MNRLNGQVVNILAFWRWRLGLLHKTVKQAQVALYSPKMQICQVCLDASYGDAPPQAISPNRYNNLTCLTGESQA